MRVTHSLTHSLIVSTDLTDVTLVSEDTCGDDKVDEDEEDDEEGKEEEDEPLTNLNCECILDGYRWVGHTW